MDFSWKRFFALFVNIPKEAAANGALSQDDFPAIGLAAGPLEG